MAAAVPFYELDRKWNCACGIHCEQGTFVVGVIFCVLGSISAITGCALASGGISVPNLIGGIITIIIGALLVQAVQRKQERSLAPAVVCLWISIILYALGALALVIFGIIGLAAGIHSHRVDAIPTAAGGVLLGLGIALFFYLLVHIWFLRVVNQYRRFLQERQMAGLPSGDNTAGYVITTTTVSANPHMPQPQQLNAAYQPMTPQSYSAYPPQQQRNATYLPQQPNSVAFPPPPQSVVHPTVQPYDAAFPSSQPESSSYQPPQPQSDAFPPPYSQVAENSCMKY